MAIAYDNETAKSQSAVQNMTLSHTCSGNSRFLVVGIRVRDPASYNVTSVTYNGVAMTKIANWQEGTQHGAMYVLFNPASGANDLVVNTSATNNNIAAHAVSYTGVKKKAAVDASDSNSTSTGVTSLSETVTPAEDGGWVMGAFIVPASVTPGAGDTERGTAFPHMLDSGPVDPAAATTVSATFANTGEVGVIAVAVSPAKTKGIGGLLQML